MLAHILATSPFTMDIPASTHDGYPYMIIGDGIVCVMQPRVMSFLVAHPTFQARDFDWILSEYYRRACVVRGIEYDATKIVHMVVPKSATPQDLKNLDAMGLLTSVDVCCGCRRAWIEGHVCSAN